MPAIQPIVTPAWVVGLFMTFGVIFVPLGTWLKLEYAKVVEIERRYEGTGRDFDCSISAPNEGREVGDTIRAENHKHNTTSCSGTGMRGHDTAVHDMWNGRMDVGAKLRTAGW